VNHRRFGRSVVAAAGGGCFDSRTQSLEPGGAGSAAGCGAPCGGGRRLADPPYELTLVVIVAPGTLPVSPDDELPDRPAELNSWLYDDTAAFRRGAGQIATRLAEANVPAERYWL
jgi:hypothetical protein